MRPCWRPEGGPIRWVENRGSLAKAPFARPQGIALTETGSFTTLCYLRGIFQLILFNHIANKSPGQSMPQATRVTIQAVETPRERDPYAAKEKIQRMVSAIPGFASSRSPWNPWWQACNSGPQSPGFSSDISCRSTHEM